VIIGCIGAFPAWGGHWALWNQEFFGLSLLAGSRPCGRLTFLCFAKEKQAKERRAGCVVPSLRYGHTALLAPGGARRNSPFGLKHLRTFFRPSLRYSPTHDGSNTGERSTRVITRSGCGVFGSVRTRPVAWFSASGFGPQRSHDPLNVKPVKLVEAGVSRSSPLRQG